MSTTACDISYWQPPVDDSYPHRWLIFRCCDATFHDPNCDHNNAWASAAVANGRLDGWTAYGVYRPGMNPAVLNHAARLPPGGHVMIDVESWGGAIGGDHSTEINALLDGLRALFPGQLIPGLDRVWAYGNRADLASIFPNRGNTPVVVASYGGSKPDVPNLIGWQYTDGRYSVAGLPSSTPPFGACDHNELYLPTSGDQMSAAEIADLKSYIDKERVATVAATNTAIAAQAAADRAWLQAYIDSKLGGTINRVVGIASDSASAAKVLTGPGGVVARVVDVQAQVAAANAHLTTLSSAVATIPAAAAGTAGPVDLAAVAQAAHDGALSGANLNGKTLTIHDGGTV